MLHDFSLNGIITFRCQVWSALTVLQQLLFKALKQKKETKKQLLSFGENNNIWDSIMLIR